MRSIDIDDLGATKDGVRRRLAGLDRRDLLKKGAGIAATQVFGANAKAAGATRKIALEEHFTTPALAKKYVARPARSDALFADIERRLADFGELRLETMDKAGIDLAVLSVTTPAFGGTFTRFPRLKIILGHMGETLPFLLWRFDSRWQCELGEDLRPGDLPSAIIRSNFVITTSGVCDPGPLAEAIGALGEDSVMFSIDYPYEDTQTASAFIESAPISEVVRTKVCHGNAERILRL
jgi:Amidohydrolase